MTKEEYHYLIHRLCNKRAAHAIVLDKAEYASGSRRRILQRMCRILSNEVAALEKHLGKVN